jgi:hypothetical protein
VASLPTDNDQLAVLAAGYDDPSLGQAINACAAASASADESSTESATYGPG